MTDTATLMARMLTCAARITEVEATTTSDAEMRSVLPVTVTRDACSLLIEAAAELEKLVPAAPLGEPMEVIEPKPDPFHSLPAGVGVLVGIPETGQWYDPMATLKQATNVIDKQCPRCGSNLPKTAFVRTRELECPECDHQWKWRSRVRQR